MAWSRRRQKTTAGARSPWTKRMLGVLTDFVRTLWAQRLVLFLGFWLALVFAERLVVDRWLHVYGEESHFRFAASDIAVWTYFLLGFPLLTYGLAVTKKVAEQSASYLGRMKAWTIEKFKDFRFYPLVFLLLFLAFVFRHLEEPMSMTGAARQFVAQLFAGQPWVDLSNDVRRDAGQLLLMLALAAGGTLIFQRVAKGLERRPRSQELRHAFAGWRLSNGFFLANLVVWLVVYWLALDRGSRADPVWPSFTIGLLKDAAIYHLLAFGVVNAMFRWERCADELPRGGRWHFLGVYWLGVFISALLALTLDLLYVEKIHDPLGKFALDYPELWQRKVIFRHTYIRGFLIILPLLGFMFVRSVGAAFQDKPEGTGA